MKKIITGLCLICSVFMYSKSPHSIHDVLGEYFTWGDQKKYLGYKTEKQWLKDNTMVYYTGRVADYKFFNTIDSLLNSNKKSRNIKYVEISEYAWEEDDDDGAYRLMRYDKDTTAYAYNIECQRVKQMDGYKWRTHLTSVVFKGRTYFVCGYVPDVCGNLVRHIAEWKFDLIAMYKNNNLPQWVIKRDKKTKELTVVEYKEYCIAPVNHPDRDYPSLCTE